MKLYLKLQKYVYKNHMWRHPMSYREKILQYDGFIILWLQNSFFS
jgi:hypothetical protein